MHIYLLLDLNNQLELRITTSRHYDIPAWVVDWVKKNSSENNFDHADRCAIIQGKEKITSFIAEYESHGGRTTELNNYSFFFSNDIPLSIFSPQHLKDIFNEIILQSGSSETIELSTFENAFAKHPISSYLNFPNNDEEPKQVMVVAPIENVGLLTQIKNYQNIIAKKFNLQDEGESFFHISFAVPLTITAKEMQILEGKLRDIIIPTIEITPKIIRTFANGTIYLELDDVNNQLTQLNTKIITAIREAGIHCNIRFKEYIPHVTLFLMPATTLGKEVELINVEKLNYYLTKVILSESRTNKGITNYLSVMSLPNDFFLKSKSLEVDFFASDSKNNYLHDEFNNHPLADYYRLLAKLSAYQEKSDQELLNQCNHLYKKILGFNDEKYAADQKTMAVLMFTRGLIFQYIDRLYPLMQNENSNHLVKALSLFKKADELGYLDASKNIGMVNYELGHLSEAKKFLEKALRIGTGDAYTTQYYNQCKKDILAEEARKADKNRCRIM